MAAPVPPALEYLWERLHSLEPKSQLGGIYAPKTGYHDTRENNPPNNYSVVDAPDKGGPANMAAALDWTFPDAQGGNYATIKKYSKRLLDSGKDPHDDRLNWMREFYGQADDDTGVEGWDYRYAVPATSDSSHLWHIHFSFSRNALTNENMDKLVEVLQGGDVALSADDARKVSRTDGAVDNDMAWRTDSPLHDPPGDNETVQLQTAVLEAAKRADLSLQSADQANIKLDQIIDGGTTVVIDAALLKQVLLDPEVLSTYAKAISQEILGLRFEIAE